MLELLRVYLGYCTNCRKPKIIGEFVVSGWRHRFNLCDVCMKEQLDKLVKQSNLLGQSLPTVNADPNADELVMTR